MARESTPLTNERTSEIMGEFLDDVPVEKSAAERQRDRKKAAEDRCKKAAEEATQRQAEAANYSADPPSPQERMSAFMECLAHHDTSLEERIEAEQDAKEYRCDKPGITGEEVGQIVRAVRLGAAKRSGELYGARLPEVAEWMRKDWPGMLQCDAELTGDEAIRRKLATRTDDGRYDITADGRAFVRELGGEPAAGQAEEATPGKATIPRRAQKAWREYQQAAKALNELAPLDKNAYDSLAKSHEMAGEREDLPSFSTWQRNLREYRRLTGQQKNKRRIGRADTARSVVKQTEL